MEPLLIPDDLNCNEHARFVINAAHDLSKASLTQHIHNLIAIR